jgi:O-antigen/teichoic acid export membrane protein
MAKSEIKFLLTHSSIYGVGTIASQAVSFLMLPLYTNHLTTTDYGILELIDTTNMLLGLIVTLGVAEGMVRFYYEVDSSDYKNTVISTTYACYMGASLVFLPPLIGLSPILSRYILAQPEFAKYFVISFISLFLGGLTDIGLMCLRLNKKATVYITITITRLITLILLNIYFLVFLGMGVIGILLSSLIGRGIYAGILTYFILNKTKLKFSKALAYDLIKYTLPLVPAALADTLIKQSDKYFVVYLMSVSYAGIYALALKMGNAIHYLMTVPFLMAFLPRRYEIIKQERTPQFLANIFRQYSIAFIFIGLTISIYAHDVLRVMVSEGFREAGNYVPLIILSLLMLSFQYHFDIGIQVAKKTKIIAVINITAAILQIICNYILIKNFGLWGAIFSSVVAITFQAFMYLYYSNKFYKIKYEISSVVFALAISVVLFLITIVIDSGSTTILLLSKLVILLSYIPFLIIFKIISKDEILKIREITKFLLLKIRKHK